MGAVTSLNPLAIDIASGFSKQITEMCIERFGCIDIKYYTNKEAIKIALELDNEKMSICFVLIGKLGQDLGYPRYNVATPFDLYKALSRGGKSYERYIKHVPSNDKMASLIREKYGILCLAGINKDLTVED